MRVAFRRAIPVLHISNSVEAEEFYCDRLGFRQDFAYRPFGGNDPGYLGLTRDDVWLHLSSFSGDGVSGGVVNLFVDDVDALYAEFVAQGIPIAMEPTDQSWGNREMHVRDADGNSLRFIREKDTG